MGSINPSFSPNFCKESETEKIKEDLGDLEKDVADKEQKLENKLKDEIFALKSDLQRIEQGLRLQIVATESSVERLRDKVDNK